MKKLRLFGFDNLPEEATIGTGPTGYGLAYSELLPLTVSTLSPLVAPRIVNNQIIVGKQPGNTASHSGTISIKIGRLIGDATPNWCVIGFRFRRLAATSSSPHVFVVRGSATTAAGDWGVYCPANLVTSDDCYIEIVMDFNTNKWYRFVDDVQAQTGTISNFSKSSLSSQYWGIGIHNANWIASANAADVWSISDIYTLVDDGNDAPVPLERLGPITVKRLPVISAIGAGYTPSDGSSVPSVLNVGREDSASLNTPYAEMPAGQTPLKLKFDPSSIGVKEVLGVDVKISSTKITDGQNFNVNFSYAGNDSTLVPMTPSPGGATVNVAGGILTNTLPGGSKLSPTNVGDLEVVITPTS